MAAAAASLQAKAATPQSRSRSAAVQPAARSVRVATAARRSGSSRARGGLVVARAATAAPAKDEATGKTYVVNYSYSLESRHEVLMFEALRSAMIEEMNLDPTVCMIGEDVGHYGGSYKVSKGLSEMFGDLRVLDTPIAQNSFTGMAVGAAMKGLRPVVEGMNMGFLLLAYNQISNSCGMLHYSRASSSKC